MSDSGTYLYAVASESVPVDVPGVAGTPVRTLTRGALVAYVSTVPLAEFGEEPLRHSLEDLDWLAETARAHHRVVEEAARVPVAPVRLVTVYADDDQVHELLDRRGEEFLAVLFHVTGRREWGVKAYAGQAAGPAATPVNGGDPGRPGTSYLSRRRESLRGREQARRLAVTRAEHIHASLSRLAVASRRHRAQDPRLSGHDEWMLLNGAYLVDVGRDEEFAALVGSLGGDGVDVRLTGPWAPYSFTVLEPG
ncbi:GvpL/GvpF family gas vesicle protein [Nonomuraea jiangxiensis]|uniref:Gas vesicle synthesis protein GvpL/GvpF n=1 Tax=Nonomuraea jiangxiensis TaxID=633440 RepID=A0A1G8FLB8_9ACTN|nr:GvpL/GvpF family gas vesicle protein [Nonomuraea jiangxiensis]SDH82911.1 Gas vesicle synthesis protein GvpL/GvpF [Nonomuraea jiangxiensis]